MIRIIFSVMVAYLVVYVNKSPSIAHAGWFVKFIGFAIAIFGAGWGIKIGEKVRNFAMPDFVLTDGSVTEIVKTKVFWAVGIQAIGCFVGAIVVATLYFKVAGPSPQQVAQEQAAINRAKNEAAQAQWNKEHAAEIAAYEKRNAEAEAYDNLMRPSQDMRDQFQDYQKLCDDGAIASVARQEYSPLTQETVTIPAKENPEKLSCEKAKNLIAQIRQTGVCLKSERDDIGQPQWEPCNQSK